MRSSTERCKYSHERGADASFVSAGRTRAGLPPKRYGGGVCGTSKGKGGSLSGELARKGSPFSSAWFRIQRKLMSESRMPAPSLGAYPPPMSACAPANQTCFSV